MFRFLLFVVLLYAALLILLHFKQRSLIFQPDNDPIQIPEHRLATVSSWPSESDFQGYLVEPDNAIGTVVVFHGNAGQAAHRLYYVNALIPLKLRVLLVEYPGYGERAGSPSEVVFRKAGREAVKAISDTYPDQPLHLLGESLGTGVVASIVSNGWANDIVEIRSLILITPFDSLASVAQTHYWYTPAKWLIRDKFDNVTNLAQFAGMKRIVLAGRDTIIPVHHGERLFRALPETKHRTLLDNAGHNDWLNAVDEQWWSNLMSTQ